MPETGLEPAPEINADQPLKLARLPIPPLRLGGVFARWQKLSSGTTSVPLSRTSLDSPIAILYY